MRRGLIGSCSRWDANFPNVADAEHEANVGLSKKQ
jgi:hypothetical protein